MESRSVLDEVVAFAFPDADIQGIRTLDSTGDSGVVRVELPAGAYVVKCAPVEAAESLRREVAVTNYVRQHTEIPVVEFQAVELDTEHAPAPFYVADWVTGPKLGTVLDSKPLPMHGDVFENLGGVLATLHDATGFEALGSIQPVDDSTFEIRAMDDWVTVFRHALAREVQALDGTRFESLASDVWTYVTDRLSMLDTGTTPVLLHGDIGDGNVVCDDSTVVALLDWEHAFIGHPEYDVCRAETRYFWNSWGSLGHPQSKLYDGYRSRRSLDPGFEQRRACYLATFSLAPLRSFSTWGPRFSDDIDELSSSLSRRIRGIFE